MTFKPGDSGASADAPPQADGRGHLTPRKVNRDGGGGGGRGRGATLGGGVSMTFISGPAVSPQAWNRPAKQGEQRHDRRRRPSTPSDNPTVLPVRANTTGALDVLGAAELALELSRRGCRCSAWAAFKALPMKLPWCGSAHSASAGM